MVASLSTTNPYPKSEVLTCPSCGHPVCPICANTYDEDPDTVEKAREYMQSCDDVSGRAYCGQCGDWGEDFMLRFLKLIDCPIPPEFESAERKPRQAQFLMTNSISQLPNAGEIMDIVREQFDSGASGIIKVSDATGEIWGYPERHPEGWIVTVLYPHER